MIYNFCFKFAIAAIAVMMATSAVNAQVTFTVTNLNDDGPESLREAITMANLTAAEDTIVFSVAGTIETESQLPRITQAVTIDGGGVITIDAGNGEDDEFATGDGFRIFDIDDRQGDSVDPVDNITLIGLTLTGGDTPEDGGISQSSGGAIRNREILNLENVQIVDNAAGGGGTDFPDGINGGGIFNLAGLLTLTDCTVSGNRAGDGAGAVGFGQDATGGEGGGIFSSTSSRSNFPPFLVLINTTVSGNFSGAGGTNDGDPAPGGRGGGIFTVSNTVIVNSTISGNSTDSGTVEDPTFEADGGGIAFITFGSRSLNIFNSTITDNVVAGADSTGGGIYANRAVIVENSIIAGNIADDNTDFEFFDGGVLIANHSLIEQADVTITSGGDNLIGVSPNLGPLADNGGITETHALLAGSPAIDAGDPNFDPVLSPDLTIDFDQRGDPFARVADGGVDGLRIDMGAYELSGVVVVTGDVNCDGAVDFLDIAPFINLLATNGFSPKADINGDGLVNFLDIAPFINLLAGA